MLKWSRVNGRVDEVYHAKIDDTHLIHLNVTDREYALMILGEPGPPCRETPPRVVASGALASTEVGTMQQETVAACRTYFKGLLDRCRT